MFSIKAFLFVVVCVAATTATTFRSCEEGNAPTELRVEGCNEEPCDFYRGEDVVAEWDFTVVKDTDNLKPVVKAIIQNMPPINYPLPEENACKSLTNGECPLDKDEHVTYSRKIPIRREYPKIALALIFSLIDKANNVHVCFKLDVKIADR